MSLPDLGLALLKLHNLTIAVLLPFLTDGWDPMVVEVVASLAFLRGKQSGKQLPVAPVASVLEENGQDFLLCYSFGRTLEVVAPVDLMGEESEGALLFSNQCLARRGVDLTYQSPCERDNLMLSSPGLLSSAASLGDPEASPWMSPPCSPDPACSPRSVMDMFQVSLSPASKTGRFETVDCQQDGCQLPAQDFASFRGSCRRPISPVLPRPATRRCRSRKAYPGPVRRSRRIGGRFAAGTPIRQQQRTLITRLGLAREGEAIGDEALDAYLDLFARPLRQQHIDVVLRLFGWQPDALPLSDEALVECVI
jgi:hypothetical protein